MSPLASPAESSETRSRVVNIGLRANTRTSGGGIVFLRELTTALAAHADARVTVFAIGDPAGVEWPTDVDVVPVRTPRNRHVARLVATRTLQREVDRHPVDILICPGTEVTPVLGPEIAVWPLTVAPFEASALEQLGATRRQRLRWELLRHLVVRACRHADRAFFSSEYARDLHAAASPRLQMIPTTVIHPGVSLTSAGPTLGSRGAQGDHLLFVSHLYPYKMVVEMIEAYGIAARRCPEIPPLMIAGDTRDMVYAERVKAARQATGVADRIVLLGGVDQVRLDELYRNARAFVFPSISENAGSYALIDAFAYGLPVISSSTSSMPEVCGDAALLVDPREPADMAEAMIRVCTDADLAAALSTRSRARMGWFPTWSDIAAKVVTAASEATSRGGR